MTKPAVHAITWGSGAHPTRDGECCCGLEVHDATPSKASRAERYRVGSTGPLETTMPPCTRGDDEPATPAALAAVGEE